MTIPIFFFVCELSGHKERLEQIFQILGRDADTSI
jgi:hypothetical protein